MSVPIFSIHNVLRKIPFLAEGARETVSQKALFKAPIDKKRY